MRNGRSCKKKGGGSFSQDPGGGGGGGKGGGGGADGEEGHVPALLCQLYGTAAHTHTHHHFSRRLTSPRLFFFEPFSSFTGDGHAFNEVKSTCVSYRRS